MNISEIKLTATVNSYRFDMSGVFFFTFCLLTLLQSAVNVGWGGTNI